MTHVCLYYFQYINILTDTVTTMATGLNMPRGIAFTPSGTLAYLLSSTQVLTMPVGGGTTSVLAGQTFGGWMDGQGTDAKFQTPSALVVHPGTGTMYIADMRNHRIRVCTALGLVSTLVGSDESSKTDGAASIATFDNPSGIVMDLASTYLYVSCKGGSGGAALRKVRTFLSSSNTSACVFLYILRCLIVLLCF